MGIIILIRHARSQGWLTLEDLSTLENATFSAALEKAASPSRDETFRMPDYEYVHAELAKPNVTLNEDDRHLDRNFILELASCNYIPHAQNIIIVGPTGAGKSYLAQALGQAACRRFLSTRYIQLPDLLDELKAAKAKGPEAFHRLRKQFVKYELLIIDEWLLFPINEEDSQLLLSLIDRRHNHQATIISSQFEPAEWLDQIPIPVAAEAITDRLSAQAYSIIIKGKKSMRLSR